MSKLWEQLVQLNAMFMQEDAARKQAAQKEALQAQQAMDQAIAVRDDASAVERARFEQAQCAEEAFFKEYGGDPPASYISLPNGELNYGALAMGEDWMCSWVTPLDFDEGLG